MGISLANVDVGGIFSGIGTLARDLSAAITGKEPIDSTKAAELALKVQELETSIVNAQSQINLVEASSTKFFVSGARPAAMWVCVAGFSYNFIGYPFLSWLSLNFGWIAPPVIDATVMMNLLFGMLGLGAMRTVEKTKNVASK
jgi:hypothetical protein